MYTTINKNTLGAKNGLAKRTAAIKKSDMRVWPR